ncbi:hypothetical protein CKAH01_04137 [Colletotrichum kahawae]|uniref:Uncharacterized protein n=1 Tax=Colletotrichum kahawae TaxID=34407 RepID=A0AAE0DCR9_COLKA|nr:hypothetical protein CKAH01_04137 [Colletotrichum kahawae]
MAGYPLRLPGNANPFSTSLPPSRVSSHFLGFLYTPPSVDHLFPRTCCCNDAYTLGILSLISPFRLLYPYGFTATLLQTPFKSGEESLNGAPWGRIGYLIPSPFPLLPMVVGER